MTSIWQAVGFSERLLAYFKLFSWDFFELADDQREIAINGNSHFLKFGQVL